MKRLLLRAGRVLILSSIVSTVANAAPCEKLRSLSLPATTITAVEVVPAGPFQAPGNPAPLPMTLPAHCRVAAVLTPSSDSRIAMEVWLPAENWNGKFEAVGNGGWAGVISYAAMAQALNEGYATASTDTGHTGGNALFAIAHPEKLNDFAYRAIHEMTVSAKAIVTAFYGQPAKLSYFDGCSTGGRQGLMEAQKYPLDYDGIVTGAPVTSETHLGAWHMWMSAWIVRNPDAALSSSKLEIVNKAVLQACDAADGVRDGLLNDPRRCTFDIGTLQCRGGDAPDCLTAEQVASMKRAYGAATLKNGAPVFPGKELGSELGLGVSVGGQALGLAMGDFQIGYGDAAWDVKSFDIDRDLPIADAKSGVNNAIEPNLSAFKAHGGKLLLYHGWNDQLIAPRSTIDYYDSVRTRMGGLQDDFVRLFMLPGMQHCGGGPGPNQVNWMAAMERWREGGTPPVRIDAAHVTNNVST